VKGIDEKLDKMIALLERLTAQRAADAAPRRQRRPAVQIDPAEFADLTHEQAIDKLSGHFERVIRARRLEMLGRQ
jgi:hypothetical protein